MAALTRKESEERQAAVLRFFVENPRATGEEAQRALQSGRLTGVKGGPPMGNGMLYKLQRQAQELASKGAASGVSRPVSRGESAALDDEALHTLRERGRELQKLLVEAPGTILEVHITRDGIRVVRMKATEESL